MSEGRGRGRGRARGRGEFAGGGRGRGDFAGGGRGRGDFAGGGRGRGDFAGGGRGRDGGGGRYGGPGGRYPARGGRDQGGRGGRGAPAGISVAPESAFRHGLLQQPGKVQAASGFRKPDSSKLASLVGGLSVSGAGEQAPSLPRRPGFGQSGAKKTILANHFLIRFKKDATDFAVKYDVDIQGMRRPPKGGKGKAAIPGAEEPAGESSRATASGSQRSAQRPLPADKSRLVMTKLAGDERWPVGWSYDGRKSIYAPGVFLKGGPEQDQKFEVKVDTGDGRMQSFEVRIREVAVVSIDALREWMNSGKGITVPSDTLQAIDIVLRHRASMIPGTVSFGRGSIFVPHRDTTVPLGEGAEVWLGYQQAAKPCQRGLTICINQAAAAFISAGPLINRMADAARLRLEDLRHEVGPQSQQYRSMRKAAVGVQIEVTHLGQQRRKYRVNGLSTKPADKDMFDHDELGKISISHYFKSKYNMALRYPKLPCVMVGGKGSRLPPEVCNVVAGMRVRKLTPNQTQQMIRQAAAPPNIKQQTIQKQLDQNLRFGLDPQAAAFGIEVDSQMMQIPARVLKAPVLEYTQPKRLEVTGGSWNLRTCKFRTTGAVSPWAVCCFLDQHQAQGRGPGEGVQQFVADLTQGLTLTGLRFTPGWEKPQLFFCNQNSVAHGLRNAVDVVKSKATRPPTIIVCILPTKDTDLYRAVKRAGDSELGVITQCIVATQAGITKPPKGREQYCANVAMKINAKLGGTNAVLSQTQLPLLGGKKPFIIFGADVTHPGAGSAPNTPSIAAVVGSMDAFCARYASRIQMQEHRVEIITNLKEAIKGLMMDFYRFTSKKPESVVFYRDGVSEGQFAQVIDQEVSAMREAFNELQEGYQPPVTFVVVQKRHLTRLFPMPGEGDRKGNVLPGTVVDQHICHPHEYDFFLASHEGIQGTVRPVHYHVLVDENKLSPDGMQLMTHHLCYLYCRCTRSVSICPPAYYAHLVAERGRLLCSAYASDSDSESMASGQSGGAVRPPSMENINQALTSSMFFV